MLISTQSNRRETAALPWSTRPSRELIRLALPITISMMSFATMTLASTAFVAQLGSDELAAVGLGGVVGFALVCFGIGLLRGGKTLVSQAVGADRRDALPGLIGAALGLAVVLLGRQERPREPPGWNDRGDLP
jgi:Na+-driven multidrug efflux pump